MSKTTALTFTAAVVLFAACVTISLYGQRIAQSRMYTADEQFMIYDAYDIKLESWERVAGLTGLLAISVTFAGAMLWSREMQPRAQQPGSVLGLDMKARRRIGGATSPWKSEMTAEIRVTKSSTHLHEGESLTPLERVIREY